MITVKNLVDAIEAMRFESNDGVCYIKKYDTFDCEIVIDLKQGKIQYPEDKGLVVNDKTTCNFDNPENFVVLECVNRLLDKGYRPEHLELEKRWKLGHEQKSGKADICVHDKDGQNMLVIIECKTEGIEFNKGLSNLINDGGQLFSYWQQERSAKWLVLYSSDCLSHKLSYKTESIDCSDDANIVELAKKDESIQLYSNAHTVSELYNVWDETYEKRFCGDVIFRDDTQSYNIGVKPLRKKDLLDFGENDKIVNKFEEILRHNNVSDKENAFNRLIALFICKLVDEIQKSNDDIVDFQYKAGTDTYETLQDRLQKLHKEGMQKFMKEDIFYVSDDYAENLVHKFTGQKRVKMIQELKGTLRILKFYTNNDFAFKDVHNEGLFYQNGKILVEVVQLFEKYRIIESEKLQFLGDLFEQLLNKGFKQNEGQFFTPIPVTRFIWDSLPLEQIVKKNDKVEFPQIIDYACGAGHFLTEGFEAVNECIKRIVPTFPINRTWVEKKLYGIEKDYRLARVSKISLFMHGAGDGNIIYGDGLENYVEKSITPCSFDILVANPPYSVSGFKPHLKVKNNVFRVLNYISNDASEIETLFVERIKQLLKPGAVAAIILPDGIVRKDTNSFISAREEILENFEIKSIVRMESNTFGQTGQPTVIMFLKKNDEPPKRADVIEDSIDAIWSDRNLDGWEDKSILEQYCLRISCSLEKYREFLKRNLTLSNLAEDEYFENYYNVFISSTECQNKKDKISDKFTKDEFEQWVLNRIYQIILETEKEKIRFFAFAYTQKTLFINMPSDNKMQTKFLGYKWSDRKGMEGIQIINEGGMLYDKGVRNSDSCLAGMIRNAYLGNEIILPDMEEYAFYAPLQDMMDFDEVSFCKTIKLSKPRKRELRDGYKKYKLSDRLKFSVNIGSRVKADELSNTGKIPVYSANVHNVFGKIDKLLITDFSKPSILWGIDGDWMVNIIKEDVEFYPTDHCGYLRILMMILF